jgi:DNA polymerase (family 10)
MINLNLANILTNIAEVKKSKPDNKPEVLSLMKASRTLRDNPEVVDKIFNGMGTGDLVGIDDYCHGLVREYFEKGNISEYEQFVTKYSEDLVKFIRVTGLGRKRIFKIYDHFGIGDLKDLKNVFMTGDGKKWTTFKSKSKGLESDTINQLFFDRIQRSLEYYISLEGLNPRWPVEFYTKTILKHLNRMDDIEKTEIVGSIRRKKALIRDIDILVLPRFNSKSYDFEKSRKLLEDIEKLPVIKGLISIDQQKNDISAVYSTIYEIDIEIIIAGRVSWTWQLFKTTGSKMHFMALEEYTKKNNLLNGVAGEWYRSSADGNYIGSSFYSASSEKDIYRSIGLDYIVPELRQGRDEIELSRQGKLPDLIETGDIKGDLHIHSEWSDGLIDYKDMVRVAHEKRYEYIAISDHSISNFYGNGLSTERLDQKMGFIKNLRKKFKDINILMGAEIDIRKAGIFDYPPEIIKKLDIAIASLHSSFTNSSMENTSRAVSALEKDYFDFLAHPTGFVFGNRAPIFIDIDRIIETCSKYGKALEINSYYMRLDLNEQNARKAKEAGVKLVINSDSHRPGNMDMVELGVDLARRAGLGAEDIINTSSIDELVMWKNARNK